MRKVYNLKLEIDSPVYTLTDEEFCEGLKEVIADELGDEIKYVKLTAECVDKDQQITDLKAENERLSNILKANETVKNEKSAKLEKAEHDVKRYKIKIQKLQQQLKDNTKQVCEKIREEIKQLEQNIDNNPCFLNKEYKLELKRKSIYKNIFKILDQIEKGEL